MVPEAAGRLRAKKIRAEIRKGLCLSGEEMLNLERQLKT
jgi:hypothetical protein